MESIEERMEMPPAVNSLLSTPSISQSVLLGREPPTESENGPRAATSLVAEVVRNLLGVDDLAEGGIRGLHCHFGRYDFNRGTHGGGGQREIQFALLIHLQFYILALH